MNKEEAQVLPRVHFSKEKSDPSPLPSSPLGIFSRSKCGTGPTENVRGSAPRVGYRRGVALLVASAVPEDESWEPPGGNPPAKTVRDKPHNK